MANRQNTLLIKRSNIVGKIPQLSGLTLGELALNTADAKLYTLFTSGTTGATEVREIGWDKVNISGGTINGNLTINGDLNVTGNTTLYDVDVQNNLQVSGTVNGVTVETHATRHQFGGSDPVGSTTPSANAIPYADVNGSLDSWISTASTITLGKVKISNTPLDSANPIVVSTTDVGYLNSITGFTYSANTLTGTNVSGGTVTTTIGLRTKAGSVGGSSFTGNPKTFDVVFTTAYQNTSYSINITGGINRTFAYENKTTTGFRINSNANLAFTENVDWQTIAYGES